MYEANPMSWLVEQAGGAESNEKQRSGEIKPTQMNEGGSVIRRAHREVERVRRRDGKQCREGNRTRCVGWGNGGGGSEPEMSPFGAGAWGGVF